MSRKSSPSHDEDTARDVLQRWADDRVLKLIRIEEEVLAAWQKVLAERPPLDARPELKVTRLPGAIRLAAAARQGKTGRPTPLCFIRDAGAGRYHVRMGDGAEFECGARISATARATMRASLIKQAERLARPPRTMAARRTEHVRTTHA